MINKIFGNYVASSIKRNITDIKYSYQINIEYIFDTSGDYS